METPKEPYPIQAVLYLAANFSRGNFQSEVEICRNVISQVIAEDNSSPQQIARVRILRYVDLQLSRATRWIDRESDLMALVLRGLIKLRFWAHFVSQRTENAAHFLEEANSDSKDLYDRLLKAFPKETTPFSLPPTVKRVNPTRIDDVEEVLWKVCSKFVHPTSFVLDSPEHTIYSEEYRKIFATKVLFYGWGILEMFHKNKLA